ncbi:CLUMA_CG000632, isoform A [Clunio marinus]|uniref:CLUMA_CG000632, isoform A n=1 Tax=Clunio marinus TaxID=568069 RepID=A0A1J1HKN5_9DIPT|nr:CLUMA_CG000632, isoform A [Clunio marinus]
MPSRSKRNAILSESCFSVATATYLSNEIITTTIIGHFVILCVPGLCIEVVPSVQNKNGEKPDRKERKNGTQTKQINIKQDEKSQSHHIAIENDDDLFEL